MSLPGPRVAKQVELAFDCVVEADATDAGSVDWTGGDEITLLESACARLQSAAEAALASNAPMPCVDIIYSCAP